MRLWIPPDAERRPDPEPARVNEAIPVVAGAVLWAVALIVALAMAPSAWPAYATTLTWTSIAGLGIGAILLLYALRRRL